MQAHIYNALLHLTIYVLVIILINTWSNVQLGRAGKKITRVMRLWWNGPERGATSHKHDCAERGCKI